MNLMWHSLLGLSAASSDGFRPVGLIKSSIFYKTVRILEIFPSISLEKRRK